MEWMLDIQLGRRNLSPIQRIAIAEKYRSIYEKQARENLSLGGRNGGLSNLSKPSQKSSKALSVENKIDVRAKLAETAGVSTDTYSKGKKILDSDNEEVKEKVLSGEMSINAGYNKIREGEAIHEVEAWKARQRSNFNLAQFSDREQCSHSEEKGQTRDIVAKIISWGIFSGSRKALVTYVELKGNAHGGNRKSDEKLFNLKNSNEPKNQSELAESYGITQQTLITTV